MQYPVNFIAITMAFKSKSHYGIDFGWNSKFGGKNVPIYAIEDGTCIYRAYQTSGGYVLHIKHANGFVSEYAHLQKNSLKIKKGDKVKRGQQIGNMGATGIVSGNHLHFGLYKGASINYKDKAKFVNPLNYLCAYKHQTIGDGTSKTYRIYKTKIVKGVPKTEDGDVLNIRIKNAQIVGTAKNGDELCYFGLYPKNNQLAIVDNIKIYTTLDTYLK